VRTGTANSVTPLMSFAQFICLFSFLACKRCKTKHKLFEKYEKPGRIMSGIAESPSRSALQLLAHTVRIESELLKYKGKTTKKVKSSTCYSASYMRQTQDQKRFTILEVAAD